MADSLGGAVWSAVLGALGGLATSYVNNKINATKQGKARYVDASVDIIEEIQISASNYWRKGGRDSELESTLKGQLERMELKLHALRRFFPDDNSARQIASDDLWQEITDADFETEARQPDSAKVGRIRAKCKCLIDLLHG